MKYFRMSYDEILYKRSYKNLVLLNASIPSYGSKDNKKKRRKNVDMHPNEFFSQFM